ncbi:hypothetical protein Ddye_005709 [Dipteronia dyeriana]|uniref:DUF7746 domain-containing protein n=1 Tax=Dipteronia dyeriana TaxID=168575 RepID=A0AAD9XGL3_9ROSI|nr:hypothetical protein Ddye_005709 [Dipteronia dyeriana]
MKKLSLTGPTQVIPVMNSTVMDLLEYQIITVLRQMHTIGYIYIKKQNMTHADVVTSLATGFEGQLFGWWSHTLSLNARTIIINHTKEIVTNTPTRTSTDPASFIPSTSTTTTTSQLDGIDVLCYTTLIHFVGNPNRLQGKEFSKLQNLKCKKLSDFKWYKDIFLTRVLQRTDNVNSYWKEKFISGVPTLFSTKVRDKMIEQMGVSDWSQIDLNIWTYGEIIATINKCGKEEHYANRCTKQKNKIRSLDIEENIKDKILQVFYEDSDSSIETTSSLKEVLVLEESSDETSSDSSSRTDTNIQPCVCKEINVLDQHDYSLILSMIDNIEDPV